MLNRRAFITGIGAAAIAAPARALEFSDDKAILDILRRRIEVEQRSVGMAVCVVTPHRKRIVTWGRERLGASRSVSADTVFEIGSITKVFTALLLAEMARRGEVGLDDPVAQHLPNDFHVPELDGCQITLADLATHTSGLPWWPAFPGSPPRFNAAFLAAAVPQFSLQEFKAWLADFRLQNRPGDAWAYGNTDYALLSMALAHRGGRPYETLLQTRVIHPLGLADTTFGTTPATASRLAEGHGQTLTPVPPFEAGIFAAAGGLRSTPRDLSRFAAAILPGSGARIAAAAEYLFTVRRPAPPIGGIQVLGWELRGTSAGRAFVSKDGVTFGQGASLVFDPDTPLAVVAFSNTTPDLALSTVSGGGVGAADVAQHLLRPQIPLGGQGGARY